MLDIKILQNSGFFKEIQLNSKDVIFDEGDYDENIYILIAGELKIEKYTDISRTETKQLATLKQFDVFGEASLNTNQKKEVKITAKRKSILLSINAKDGIKDFLAKYPKEGLNLLKYIIYLSNKRLTQANYLITANYKISKEIIELNEINNRKIFELIDKIREIIDVSYILYFEKNPVLKNYIKLKYDTRYKGKLQDKVIEITDNKLDLLSLKVGNFNNYIQKLSIGDNDFGFLVFLKKDSYFSDNDKKILISSSTSIAGLIKQKQLIEEERDKNYSR